MTSLARGLEVLCAFEGHAALTVTQAAKRTRLSRSSVARCLFTLESLGYVASMARAYHLRPSLLPLLVPSPDSDPLAKAGQPIVNASATGSKESCSLAIFDTRSGTRRSFISAARRRRVSSRFPCSSAARCRATAPRSAACCWPPCRMRRWQNICRPAPSRRARPRRSPARPSWTGKLSWCAGRLGDRRRRVGAGAAFDRGTRAQSGWPGS